MRVCGEGEEVVVGVIGVGGEGDVKEVEGGGKDEGEEEDEEEEGGGGVLDWRAGEGVEVLGKKAGGERGGERGGVSFDTKVVGVEG